jgi:DNA helicase-2/ATP-dependent DNA helicase PcrA
MASVQTPSEDYLRTLNPKQLKAATAPALGHVIIIAGPGTGKTKTISARIAWLIHHEEVCPDSIVALTFTNAAASELISRVGPAAKRVMAGTFHGFCAKLLYKFGTAIGLKPGFTIADEAMSKRLMQTVFNDKAFENFVHEALGFTKAKRTYVNGQTGEVQTVSRLLNTISKIKGDAYTIDTWANSGFNQSQFLLKAFRSYDDLLKEANALDFDDLLLYGVELFETLPRCVNPKCVLVDEYQDTNKVQFKLMCLLVGPETGLTVVGDPDQSIYKFRGAEPKNFDDMKVCYPNFYECTLTTNYRSIQPILDTCIKLINEHRAPDQERTLNAFIKASALIKPMVAQFLNFNAETAAIAKEIRYLVDNFSYAMKYEDIAILFRNRRWFRSMEYALLNENIPYTIKGSNTLLDSVEITTVLNYLKIIQSPFQDDALLNTINKPFRNIGATTLDRLNETDFSYKNLWEKLDALKRNKLEFGYIVPKTYDGIIAYHGLIKACRERLSKSNTAQDVSDIIDYIITDTKLVDFIHRTAKKSEDTIISNLEMLKKLVMNLETSENYQALESMSEIPAPASINSTSMETTNTTSKLRVKSDCLSIFLREISLKASVPRTTEGNPNRVVLSTIHMAKGLEWKTVFVPNLAECLIYEPNDEEERRVFFVGLTRAAFLLYISYCDAQDFTEKVVSTANNFVDTYLTPELLQLCVVTQNKFGNETVRQQMKNLFGAAPPLPKCVGTKRKLSSTPAANHNSSSNFSGGFRSAAAVLEDAKSVDVIRQDLESKKGVSKKRRKAPATPAPTTPGHKEKRNLKKRKNSLTTNTQLAKVKPRNKFSTKPTTTTTTNTAADKPTKTVAPLLEINQTAVATVSPVPSTIPTDAMTPALAATTPSTAATAAAGDDGNNITVCNDTTSAPVLLTRTESDEVQVTAVKSKLPPPPASQAKKRGRKPKPLVGNTSIMDHFKIVKK